MMLDADAMPDADPMRGRGRSTSCDWHSASILLQADDGMSAMLCNWMLHYRLLRLPNPVYVVAFGAAVAQQLVRIPDLRVVSPPKMAVPLAQGTSNYGSATFYALNTAKIKAAQDLLEATRRPVVFSDVDTVWIRNPLRELNALPSQKSFAVAPDANELSPCVGPGCSSPGREGNRTAHVLHHVCACFFAVCARGQGRRVLDAWWAAAGAEAGRTNEQKALQKLLDARPELITGNALEPAAPLVGPVAILPHAVFPTGRHDPPVTPQAAWVHANWIQRKTRTSTTTAKRNRLRAHGLWKEECTHLNGTAF